MRILHVDTGKSWRGGQGQVMSLHRELTKAGVSSHLVCSESGELYRRAKGEGLSVEEMPLRGEWDIFSARRIAKLLKTGNFTHLHLHSSHAQGIGLVAARLAGFRNVIVTRRVDFVPKKHLFNRWKYGSGVARFVAISLAIKEILVNFGVSPEKIRLVHSGVDPDKTRPGSGESFRRELGLAPGELLAGNISHLADHKGLKYLIDAVPLVLANHPNTRFVIVGSGELEEELKMQAKSLGLGGKLVFTGFRKDVDAIMDGLDIFVMSSHMEGLGTIVMDALASKTPVVVTGAGGIPEIVEDEKQGFVVPAKDPKALAGGIIRLLESPELRAAFGEAGRKRVIEKFSARAMMEGNLRVYEELLK
ncbi:glycosyltransferase family 1 protein [bacterium]|nr:MAG: glycosyltransferase family 1 protein [bacterium]